jgi:poly(3-hydroxybutyrate) depolymerase
MVAPILAAVSGGPASHADQLAVTRQDWPCTGCVVHIPSGYNPAKPNAILVALHGDEGNPSLIAPAWTPVSDRFNVILFAAQCPTNEGCRLTDGQGNTTNSWWGWLQYSPTYDDAWIGRQVDLIAAQYNLDAAREYLTGWSGGADYLRWYALAHADRFAAANWVVGGIPYYQSCPTARLAGYFLMGSNDFRYLSGQPSQVRAVLAGCHDPTNMAVLAGYDHQGTIDAMTGQGYGNKIMKWLMTHTLRPAG